MKITHLLKTFDIEDHVKGYIKKNTLIQTNIINAYYNVISKLL